MIPGPMLRDETKTDADEVLDTPVYARDVIYFPCSDVKCQAWLYLPKHTDSSKPPIVVAAHGLGRIALNSELIVTTCSYIVDSVSYRHMQLSRTYVTIAASDGSLPHDTDLLTSLFSTA